MIAPMFNSVETVTVSCRHCERRFDLTVSTAGLIAWQNGMLIQNALPELTADERELLISRTCGECWDKMFS